MIQIKETCLYSKDLELSEEFYSTKLSFQLIQKVQGRHIFYQLGNTVLLIFNPLVTAEEGELPSHFGYGNLHIAFEVEISDYDNWKLLLQKHNIPIIAEHTWKKNLKSFYFRDPDNHLLEITQKSIW